MVVLRHILKKSATKVEAVTILETVIATTVLMILFSILIGVYTKILPVTYSMRHVRAGNTLEHMMQEIKQAQTYSDNTSYVEPYTIIRSIRTTGQPDFIVVELLAKDGLDSTVARYKELMQIRK